MRVLNLGCGRKQWPLDRLLPYVGLKMTVPDGAEVIHLDADPALTPDIVCRLGENEIPLEDNSVDCVLAWHVLEHVGKQGETDAWFRCWEDLYRVLKPQGWLYGECPYYSGIWAWSDPTHTRAISEHALIFFSQNSYRVLSSAISPYRIRCDFQWLGMTDMEQGFRVIAPPDDARVQSLRFALAAIKPLKPWWEDEA